VSVSDGLSGLHVGQIVENKYEIIALIGKGGMGEVFKVRHIHLKNFRVIKVMRRSLLADEKYRARFAREARIATLVQHPNVALIHDFTELPDGSHYMVCEFIEGLTVRQWDDEHGRLSVPLALDIGIQVLAGLDAIHAAGLLHRDLSADNVMITDKHGRLTAKIIDLGIAKDLTHAVAGDTTETGVFVGNPRYASPEQLGTLKKGEELDARADIYAFGLLLYEMLAGVHPFVSATPQGYAVKHLTEAPPPIGVRDPSMKIPAELESIVMKALEKNREKRFQSAREFSAALSAIAANPIVATLPPRSNEADAWDETQSSNDRRVYQRFLRQFPNGPHAAAANDRLNDFIIMDEVDELARRGDVSGLTRLGSEYADSTAVGRAVRAALNRMADESLRIAAGGEAADWDEAVRRSTVEGWNRYLDKNPDSSRAVEALQLREEARAFELALSTATATGWKSFIATWPASRLKRAAEIQLSRLTRETSEPIELTVLEGEAPTLSQAPESDEVDAWNHALGTGTKAAWQEYLNAHASSPRIAKARELFAEASAFGHAAKSNTAEAWRDYLGRWPQGAHRREAESKLNASTAQRPTFKPVIEDVNVGRASARPDGLKPVPHPDAEEPSFVNRWLLRSEAGWILVALLLGVIAYLTYYILR
jgi:serine/threonine protein kinase